MICPSRMRGYSSGSGSLTLTIISARFQTSSLLAAIWAPDFFNSSSVMPAPIPAPVCLFVGVVLGRALLERVVGVPGADSGSGLHQHGVAARGEDADARRDH